MRRHVANIRRNQQRGKIDDELPKNEIKFKDHMTGVEKVSTERAEQLWKKADRVRMHDRGRICT